MINCVEYWLINHSLEAEERRERINHFIGHRKQMIIIARDGMNTATTTANVDVCRDSIDVWEQCVLDLLKWERGVDTNRLDINLLNTML